MGKETGRLRSPGGGDGGRATEGRGAMAGGRLPLPELTWPEGKGKKAATTGEDEEKEDAAAGEAGGGEDKEEAVGARTRSRCEE